MDYRISYIYSEEERDQVEVPSFPLRLLCRDEIMHMIEKASRMAGVEIRPLELFDRSVFVGRHLETGEYNRNCPQLRSAVNSLFESYVRTDLDRLLVDYVPRRTFDHLNNYFEHFFMSCNTLVKYTISLLESFDSEAGTLGQVPDTLPFYPEPLKVTMETMRRVMEGIGWLSWGDVRANVIEPVLAFSLRKLEMELARGMGVGHGLVGVFEIRK